ncbi:E3 ubiquitin-protein ligase SHPRH [Portunus trituberculatus]|uniref:E3 ubiquitin-protein ligase SHPRH n=1 Tax=Portunus trituberculatus TaxID=210409 RepID=A0A5B7EMA8_PORTR|nr:E3 ubiquitin-protein ligase SHPRH [Portunus trituberculatus]
MVRNKQAPQQLNDAQQRRNNWNLLDGAPGPADDGGAAARGGGGGEERQPDMDGRGRGGRPRQPRQEEEEDNLLGLIANEYDDDDDDVEFIPRRVHFADDVYVDDEVEEVARVVVPRRRQRQQQQQELEYGEFNEVLDNAQFYVRVAMGSDGGGREKEKNIVCYLGNMSVALQQPVTQEELQEMPCNEFWLYVSGEADKSALYFEWSTMEGSPKKAKQRKRSADSFRFYMVAGTLPVDIWQGLGTQCHFDIRLGTLETNTLTLEVYLRKGALFDLAQRGDKACRSEGMGAVIARFFGVEMVTYSGEEVLKHDLEELYGAIKAFHFGQQYSTVDPQHPSLFPQLRPYQRSAVQWMLHQENYGEEDAHQRPTDALHCLYTEIQSQDGVVLYFNKFAGFLVKEKPLAVLPTPGGILADEMGLGKTVEVLSCMLCHPRLNVPKPEYLEPVTVEAQKTRRRSKATKRLTGEDIFTLDAVEKEEEKEVTETVTKSKSERRRSRVCSKRPASRVKVHIPKKAESEAEVTRSGRPRRNAAKRINGYASMDDERDDASDGEPEIHEEDEEYVEEEEEDEEEYKVEEKKQRIVPQSQTPSQVVEEEIKKSSEWMAIESVILQDCWAGKIGQYKKEGSYKEFRKFLRMRKKDPCYMMTLKERIQLQHKNDLARYSATEIVKRGTIQNFFKTKVEPKTYFECICGAADVDTGRFRVQCGVCGLWQHAECVQYDVGDPYRGAYVCPHCWTTQPPVTSGATLIVTPHSISYQWVNEIMKHVKHKSVRMLVYRGVATHGYTQPHCLAKFDIVITTYETLSRELNYVDLPHSNSQAGRRFRHPKRFMATPSPLPCVEWWRVCLDEAQMVECTTTKTAEMALRLAAVNRWCVTGTPVQKSVNELQGLLMFLGVDPYCVPQWWSRCLYQPYCRGVKAPLHSVLARHLWRNSKKDVIHQINIPQQTEEVHWLSFTRVEEHFYQGLLALCSFDAHHRLNKYPDGNTKLSSLDRATLTYLLQPLLKLRQACNHPQVTSSREECLANTAAVRDIQDSFVSDGNWWLAALQCFDKEFVMEVRDEMLSSYSRFEENKCLLHPVTTHTHLQLVLNAEMKKLSSQRSDMIKGVEHLHTLDRAALLAGATECHLRPTEKDSPQCLLCASHELFEEYEETLFSMRETKHSRTTEVSRETQDVKDQAMVRLATRRGHWGQGEVERVLRYLQTKCLSRVEEEVYQDSQKHFRMLEAMKKEFKNYRIWWRGVFDSVSALDEVNMATIRLRLRLPDEELPQHQKQKGRRREGDDLQQRQEAVRYILEPAEIAQQELRLNSERVVATNDLKTKLGQLLYLQNVAKTDFGKQGGHNPEPCPICQGELGEKWAVLGCCHSYCMYCIRALINQAASGANRGALKCPVCRQPTPTREISYVDVQASVEEEEVKVEEDGGEGKEEEEEEEEWR